jgi:hypothetical protein
MGRWPGYCLSEKKQNSNRVKGLGVLSILAKVKMQKGSFLALTALMVKGTDISFLIFVVFINQPHLGHLKNNGLNPLCIWLRIHRDTVFASNVARIDFGSRSWIAL